jgi:ABC-type branched-subunit amino acid transport system substrate-binding protein
MRPGGGIRRRFAVAALGLTLAFGPLQGDAASTAAQSRGKQIYLEGTSPSGGEITAIVGTEGVSLPASAVPCASCHGPDGLGRPEGGVLPPDIRWSELTKTYGHVHENGRRHPAFDEVNLARLLRSGLDPADNRLDESMPLYAMSVEDMNDLVAYIRHLEVDWDPGVKDGSIQVATLLPLQGPQGALGQAMAQVMHAYFQEVNKRGGVFGRKLELLAIPYGSSHSGTLDNLRRAFEQEGIFALVGAYTIGLDEPILEMLREQGAPLIGPFTLNPGDALINADSFYIYPGFTDQARVLAQQALEEDDEGKVRLVLAGPEGGNIDQLIAAVADQLPEGGEGKPPVLRYPPGVLDAASLADRLEVIASDAVLFLGNQVELEALLDVLAERKLSPRIYLLSAFVPRPLFDAPPAFHYRIFLAYPTLSRDMSAAGLAEYQRLADLHALPPDHLQGQVAALAAAKLLVEGLRGAGRTLNREGLVEAIEALYRYDTGLTPPLTYGPNRRIGARGAHVMGVDLIKKTNSPVGEWHEVR